MAYKQTRERQRTKAAIASFNPPALRPSSFSHLTSHPSPCALWRRFLLPFLRPTPPRLLSLFVQNVKILFIGFNGLLIANFNSFHQGKLFAGTVPVCVYVCVCDAFV